MRLLALILTLALLAPACQSDPNEKSGTADFTGLVTQGQEAFKSGRYDQALEKYQEALKQQPDSAPVYNLIGMAYRFQYNQKPDDSLKQKEIAAFEKAGEIQPTFVVALVNLGSSLYYIGKKQEASRVFKKVLELAPNHPETSLLRKMISEADSGEEKSE